jgi:major vault protein
VLGPRNDSGAREGRHFQENGMLVYDVEVLDVRILDQDVKGMLWEAQRMAILSTITRRQEELRLGDEQLKESVNQAIYSAQMSTLARAAEHEAVSRAVELERAHTRLELDKLDQIEHATHEAEALSIRSRARLSVAEQETALERQALEARAAAFREQMQALQPELIATLKSLASQKLAGELSRHLSPLAILGGESVAEVASRLLDRLPLGASISMGSTGSTGGAGARGDIRGVLGLVPEVNDGDAG